MIEPRVSLFMDILSTQVFASDASDVACDARHADDRVARCERSLRNAGVRPTRQRLMLAWLLFIRGHRHVTAEALHEQAFATGMRVSLATVYNALNQFTEAGLLRRVAVNGSKSFFDTNTSVHPHFYLEGEDVLVDISQDLVFAQIPQALPGHEVTRLDVIVHIRRKTS